MNVEIAVKYISACWDGDSASCVSVAMTQNGTNE